MSTLGIGGKPVLPSAASDYSYPIAQQRRQQPPRRRPVRDELANIGPTPAAPARHHFEKRGRFWSVVDPVGTLVCVTVYKRGAQEVIRRLDSQTVAEFGIVMCHGTHVSPSESNGT